MYSCLRVCFCSKQTFLFIVCTLTESNEPQLVQQVRPRWLLLSVCNVVKQQSLSLRGSKCGDIFRELPRYPWGRRQTLKCSAPIEGSWLILISVPYGHAFIVWSHILHALCVINTKTVIFCPEYSILQNSCFCLFSEKTTMFSANIQYGLFCLPTVPVTPSSQGYFFHSTALTRKK